MRKNVSIYSHEYRDQNMGGKKSAEQFFRKYTKSAKEKCFERNRQKRCAKDVFYIHTNIVTKKRRKKGGKQFFQKHTNSVSKKFWGKNRLIKVRKNVFYIHTNIVTKIWGGKNARNYFSSNTRIVRAKNVAKKSSERSP